MRMVTVGALLALAAFDASAQEELRLRAILSLRTDVSALKISARDDGLVGIDVADLATTKFCIVQPREATSWATALTVLLLRDVDISPGEESRIRTEPATIECPLVVQRKTTAAGTEFDVLLAQLSHIVRVAASSAEMRQIISALTTAADSSAAMLARKAGAGVAARERTKLQDPAYLDIQVDKVVALMPGSPMPVYPEILRASGVEGVVVAQFIVDTLGVVDLSSFAVVSASHELFAAAVRQALPTLRFIPAMLDGRRVRQHVRQPFEFRTDP